MKILVIELYLYRRLALNQTEFFRLTATEIIQLILGTNGSGKAQPLRSFIKTPGGWELMGNMKIGSPVIAKDGTTTKVTGVFPQGRKEIYKFTFADGRTCEATAEHLWKVYIGGKKYPIEPKIVDTIEIIRLLKTNTYGHLLWVDLIDSEQNDDVELPLDPYVLGVILGDGCTLGGITVVHPDEFIMNKVKSKLEDDLITIVRKPQQNKCLTYGICNYERLGPKSNYIINYFNKCGLMNKRSHEKFIPDIYLHASSKQRLELLQGLMDTDGTCDLQSTCSYCSSSYQLAEHVQYLVRSLGGIAMISKRHPTYTSRDVKKHGRVAYQVNIRFKKSSDLFTLPRKKERTNNNGQYSNTLKLRIESVEYSYTDETQCISIDHPEHLYVTNNFVVTHNSSILQELTPLPANHQDFLKDGYKHITIEHNGNEYILKSVFSGVQKHYFLKNGEELNTGNTLTVQRDLVRQEFNITPEIHDLMITQKGFHSMSPVDRRYWFTKLSDVNYDYAINLYKKLKDKARDVSGALKIAKKRLVVETSNLISRDEQLIIEEEVNRLYEFLNHLLELRKPVEKTIESLSLKSKSIEEDLNKFSHNIFKKKVGLKDISEFTNLDAIATRIVTYQNALEVEKILINNYITEFNKFDELSKQMKLTEDTNILALIEKIKEAQTKIETLYAKQKLKLSITDYETSKRAFDTVYDILNTVFISLPDNKDKKYSKQNLNDVTDFILKYKDKVNKFTNDLSKLQAQKDAQEHQRDHDKIECPQCQHKWSRGYDPLVYHNICLNIETIQNELDEAVIVLLEKETYLNEIKDYFSIYRDFTTTTSNWPILQPLWDFILESGDLFNQPKNVLNLIEMFKYDLTLGIEQSKLLEEVHKNNNLISICENASHEDISNIAEKVDDLDKLIKTSTEKTTFYNKEISKLINSKKDIEFILDLEIKIKKLLEEHESLTQDQEETYRRIAFNEIVKSVQINLSQKEKTLSEIKIQKALVNDLENQIESMEIDSEAYNLLVKELSPTDGLIAQGLLGFIKVFVKQMNALIKKIWAYPLEIVPCGITDNVSVELDYKFPLMVQSRNNIVSDVSKGSSAMREVVDLAFKVISMKYLGLADYPIILDEPCSAMDNEHKISSMSAITNLMNTQDFTQLFLVSHDHAQYGSLTNAEVCVLCSNNIVPPAGSKFNTHVILS